MKRIPRILIRGLVVLTTIAAAAPVNAGDTMFNDAPALSGSFVDDLPLAPASQTAVKVNVSVLPSRLIVVDENDRIIEVYSNTRTMDHGSYALRVREQDQFGPEHALTDNLKAQYERLMTEIDWGMTGRVYP